MSDKESSKSPDPATIRRLYRSVRYKVFGGVCGGFAEYFNIDVVIVRVLWVLFALTGGIGVPAYLICWIIIPQRIDAEIPLPPKSHTGLVIGIVLVILGIMLIFSWSGLHIYCFPFGQFGLFPFSAIFIIVGLGLLLGLALSRNSRPTPVPPPNASSSEKPDEESAASPELGRLYRSRDQRVISGICGGLGNYFNLDPTIIRIIWILFAFGLFGAALLVYIVLIFVIPEEPLI